MKYSTASIIFGVSSILLRYAIAIAYFELENSYEPWKIANGLLLYFPFLIDILLVIGAVKKVKTLLRIWLVSAYLGLIGIIVNTSLDFYAGLNRLAIGGIAFFAFVGAAIFVVHKTLLEIDFAESNKAPNRAYRGSEVETMLDSGLHTTET